MKLEKRSLPIVKRTVFYDVKKELKRILLGGMIAGAVIGAACRTVINIPREGVPAPYIEDKRNYQEKLRLDEPEEENPVEPMKRVPKESPLEKEENKQPRRRQRKPTDSSKLCYDENTRNLLAMMIYGEARNCSADEMIAIGETALVRARDNKAWNGRTVAEAIRKPWQYSCFNDGDPNKEKLNNYDGISKYIAEGILNGKLKSGIDATHYHTKNINPKWANSDKMTRKQGKPTWKHNFYRED